MTQQQQLRGPVATCRYGDIAIRRITPHDTSRVLELCRHDLTGVDRCLQPVMRAPPPSAAMALQIISKTRGLTVFGIFRLHTFLDDDLIAIVCFRRAKCSNRYWLWYSYPIERPIGLRKGFDVLIQHLFSKGARSIEVCVGLHGDLQPILLLELGFSVSTAHPSYLRYTLREPKPPPTSILAGRRSKQTTK